MATRKRQTIKLNESQLKRLIEESVNRILAEYGEMSNQTRFQWDEELNWFLDGIRRGDYFLDDDMAYVEIFKERGENNDPRFVYIQKGDKRLHDDHFSMQNSPELSEKQLKDIYYALGWEDELDNLVDYMGFEPY